MERMKMRKKMMSTFMQAAIGAGILLFGIEGAYNTSQAALTEADCRGCHPGDQQGNMATQHHLLLSDPAKGLACIGCHNPQNLDGSSWSFCLVRDCTKCHTDQNHVTAHNMAGVPYADCASCHDPNVVLEHNNRGLTCSVCHDSLDPKIQQAISVGKNNIPVDCADCHDFIANFGNHEKQHDMTDVNQSACTDCHSPNAVTEHELKEVYCFLCHNNTSSPVMTAIEQGMAGETVPCLSCHPTFHNDPGSGNLNPIANAGPDVSAIVNQVVLFDGSSSTDPDGSIVNYSWNFGDNTSATGGAVSHAYPSTGTYNVVFNVTDDKGATGTDVAVVTVSPPPPVPATPLKSDQAFFIGKLDRLTDPDSRGYNKQDITSRFGDDRFDYYYTVGDHDDDYSVVTMRLNREPSQLTEAKILLYINDLEEHYENIRIYSYLSDGNNVNQQLVVSYTVRDRGWKEINVSSLSHLMDGFGWMKFRVVCTSKRVKLSEAEFQLR